MDQCIETLGGAPDLENRFVTQVLVAQVELDCPPKTRLCLPVVFHFPGKSGYRKLTHYHRFGARSNVVSRFFGKLFVF